MYRGMTHNPSLRQCLLVIGGALLLLPALPAAAQPSSAPVAGLQPDRRPEGAPVVRSATVDPTLKSQRLKGVGKPWPGNVGRIAEQGAWYSPMFAPGMTAPYDLRQLHLAAAKP